MYVYTLCRNKSSKSAAICQQYRYICNNFAVPLVDKYLSAPKFLKPK